MSPESGVRILLRSTATKHQFGQVERQADGVGDEESAMPLEMCNEESATPLEMGDEESGNPDNPRSVGCDQCTKTVENERSESSKSVVYDADINTAEGSLV